MPRRQFVADLQKAKDGLASANGVSNVQDGSDDGEFTFQCSTGGESYLISVLIPELSDYPSSHTCMVFGPDHAPAAVASNLSDITDLATGKTIQQLLDLVSRKLASTGRDADHDMADLQDYEGFEEDDDDDDDDDEMEEYFPDDDLITRPSFTYHDTVPENYSKPTSLFCNRIRHDLRLAKDNGFKVGYHGGLMDGLGCYVSLSCRISKLGISEEAMQSWQLESNEYLVVILHYPNGYKSMDSMKAYDVPAARRHLGARIGISDTYKPTMQEAVRAFTVLSKEEERRRDEESQVESQSATMQKGFRNSFISGPLNELLEERFAQLLHYRYNGMSWSGAEEFYNDHIGANQAHSELGLQDKYMELENITAYPKLVTSDHINECPHPNHSLPLVGMQFVLRHFVRCTEFCLVCFSKMPDDLQAIKPYVCDKPLCLYQYMSLGFGPSIEHEILSQPKVVDLLINFCYTSARMGSLKHFPAGLSLLVPPSLAYGEDYSKQQQQQQQQQPFGYWRGNTMQPPVATATSDAEQATALKMKYNSTKYEMLFENKDERCPVRNGDWVVMNTADCSQAVHCRVIDTSLFPSVRTSESITPHIRDASDSYQNEALPHAPPKAKPTAEKQTVDEFLPATFHIYNQNFDELDDFNKRNAVFVLLDLLPSVANMKQYLRRTQDPLSSWVDRFSPAALGLLRWIIASNRACILQVNEENDNAHNRKGEDRLYGMAGWSQFRFAMGAPDKERRFIQAVRDTTSRLKLKYSTLFAWHGSPINNWHSIIREGLHFNHTAHGRAFGHGVYHSLEVATSLGYSGYGGVIQYVWPMSELQVSQAIALNEVVNAPREFVSATPHLVVAQLDWIQTRYLFVKTGATIDYNSNSAFTIPSETKPLQIMEQDPTMTPRGVSDKLIIPIHAVSGSRRTKTKITTNNNKRQKASGSNFYNPIELDIDDDDGVSVATLEEDRLILCEDEVSEPSLMPPNSTKGKATVGSGGIFSKFISKVSPSQPLTDYVPGTLDYSTLPMLQEPAYATLGATRRLMQDLKEIVKVQNREPPHELGWHIDSERIDNVYQWIVELHSFDPKLPLAKDMKAKGRKSVVLELRFGKDYPMSPPFVRVIRPRFLSFQQGGGGHITAGGAMCMELLTNDGWTAVSSIESVLLQVRMAISSLDPRPARLDNGERNDYGVGEAVEAYIRACNMHGWKIPDGFKELAYGSAPNMSFLQ